MAIVDIPSELGKAYWDKKKGVIPAGSPLETQLKSFDKKAQAIDWKAYEPGWEKKATGPKELDTVWAALEQAYRSQVLGLKNELQSLTDAAQKLGKDKAQAKPTLDAVKSITDAAKTLGKDIDQGLDTLQKAYDKAAAALHKAAGSSEGEEEESGSQLLDPKRLLSQLAQCKRNAERRVQFAFVNDNKAPPALCLAPKTAGRRLFGLLQEQTGIKTGAYGTAWIAEEVLYLSMDKPYAGLVKKVRAPLKAVGFRVRKIVLASEDGAVIEEDDELESDADTPVTGQTGSEDAPTGGEVPPAPPTPEATFANKLTSLQPEIQRGLASGHPAAAKIQPLIDFANGKVAGGQALAGLQALLTLEKLLSTIPAGSGGTTPEVSPSVDRSKAFNARLAAMQPSIKEGMAGPLAAQLKPLVAAIAAAKGNMDAAESALDAIERLLEQPAPTPSSGPTGPEQAWHQELASIEARYQQVLAGQPQDATKLRAVMAFAQEKAEAGQYAAGIAGLKQLAKLLDAAAAAGPQTDLPQPGLVAYRKSLVEFQQAYGIATAQIEALKKAIPAQLSTEAELADELAAKLRDLTTQLQDLVDQAIVAAKDERAPTTAALVDGLGQWRQEIAGNALIAHVDGNPFGVEVRIGALLGDALARILATVPTPV